MGNLFRCQINNEKREYILKAGGIVQQGYNPTYSKGAMIDIGGSASAGPNYVDLYGNGYAVTYIDFNATNWNRLHIKQARGYAWGGTASYIAVCTQTSYYEMVERNMLLNVRTPPNEPKDYVFDISNLSGIHTFCLYVRLENGLMENRLSISINGDVYLAK